MAFAVANCLLKICKHPTVFWILNIDNNRIWVVFNFFSEQPQSNEIVTIKRFLGLVQLRHWNTPPQLCLTKRPKALCSRNQCKWKRHKDTIFRAISLKGLELASSILFWRNRERNRTKRPFGTYSSYFRSIELPKTKTRETHPQRSQRDKIIKREEFSGRDRRGCLRYEEVIWSRSCLF